MRAHKFSILLLTFFLSNLIIAQTSANLQKAIDLFNKRAEGANGLTPKPEIIEEAIGILEKEMLIASQHEKASLYYLLSLNFKARFVCKNEDCKKPILEHAIKIGKTLKDKYPNNGPICFEYIVSVGLLGEISGVIKSINDGVVNKMRTNSEKLIAIDSLHNNGAGWKVLGVLNYRVPNLGIVFSWPSVKKSKQLLQKALKYFPNDIPNNFFYADALMENDEKALAKVYYQNLLKLEIRKDNYLEDLDFKTKTVLLLQKWK
jgi:tetratricopeptide (TPR) repeat protein